MHPNFARALAFAASVLALLSGCGGGSTKTSPPGSPGTSPTSAQVSGSSPFSATCGNAAAPGESFTPSSGVQPQIAVVIGGALVGVWEQDRWSGMGARGILTARSTDNGATWSAPQALAFSKCAGPVGPGAGYDRASDPWVTFGGSGVMYASALGFSATGFEASGGLSAVLVARSNDSGATWGTSVAVWTDTNSGASPFYFNDRDSITADPVTGNVYLVWARLTDAGSLSNPAYLALWTTASNTWTAKVLYDPGVTNGVGNETFNNEIVILPSGVVLDFFTLLNFSASTASLQVVSSTDHGATWSTAPVTVASVQSVGTTNPIPGGMLIRDSKNMAQIAVDSASGNIAAVWQQSSFGGTTSTVDGIALSLSTDGGKTWSGLKQVNGDKTHAAFDPTVRYLPGGVLAVTYYDFRDYVTGSSVLSTSFWLSESSDGGTTWHELRQQSPFDLNKAPLADSGFGTALFLGDNQGLALVASNALPFYAATNSAGGHVYATQSPSPLTSSASHVYTAAAARPLTAAAAAKAQANVERMRLRGVPTAAQQ